MKFLGNYLNWINPEWIEFSLTHRGIGRPKEGQQSNSLSMKREYDRAKQAGYSDNEIYFWMFNQNNVNFQISQPPFIEGKFHWWITKMLPGNFMPMHIDPHTTYQKNSQRFWIPLQDWEYGHIFLYKDFMPVNYKAGDVWVYDDPTALHGAGNIGFTPRVVLQLSTYDE